MSPRSCSGSPVRRRPGSCSTCTTRERPSSPRGTGSRPKPTSPASMPTVCGPRCSGTDGRSGVPVARVPFRRRRGAIEATLDPAEADLLRGLCRQLSDLFDAGQEPEGPGGADPVLERLFPRAYLDPTEEEAEAEWQRLVHRGLMDRRPPGPVGRV